MIKPIKHGLQAYGDSMTLVWGVFDRSLAEAQLGEVITTGDAKNARRLVCRTDDVQFQQETNSEHGGSRFAFPPEAKVFGKKVLIQQVVGVNV